MPIQYYLLPNPFLENEHAHAAKVQVQQALGFDALIQEAKQRGTSFSEVELRACGELLFNCICHLVAQGNNVNLPIGNFKPSIAGVFNHATDGFDAQRDTVKASVTQGALLEQYMANANVQKVQKAQRSPVLIEFLDINSQSINSQLTPGGIGKLVGKDLKFLIANAKEGIFLVDDLGNETQVLTLASHTKGTLLFIIPSSLIAGNYTIEVRKGYGNDMKIRCGKLGYLLQVS